jgi:hypothetical protein
MSVGKLSMKRNVRKKVALPFLLRLHRGMTLHKYHMRMIRRLEQINEFEEESKKVTLMIG